MTTSASKASPTKDMIYCGHGCGYHAPATRTVALHMRDECPAGRSPDANGSGPPANRIEEAPDDAFTIAPTRLGTHPRYSHVGSGGDRGDRAPQASDVDGRGLSDLSAGRAALAEAKAEFDRQADELEANLSELGRRIGAYMEGTR